MTTFLRPFACLLVLIAGLAGCATPDPDAPLPELGDFRLGHNIVVAPDVRKGPFSRDASTEELTAALSEAIEERIGGYDGDGLYHLGIGIGGYVLAQPGVPVIYTPKSVLIFDVTLYDNATQEKLNEEPFRVTAFEGLQNTAPIIGSGIARGKEEQLENLVTQGAKQVHDWLLDHPEWFEPKPGQVRTPYDRDAEAANLAAYMAQRR
ncbi:hypothetical protein EKE94_16665 [Mesobaculum littorinae]|uniref:Uncharacterized protein n=1 Tax=Mesobaculum littorinae TaxID=2486419 RepID=A0A438ADH9_9RHOB|nr:hypothetical protein [Mesobaculum littorinae]RVV96728.1 hypothetical protein EKE94_16665 [Mesobaculum littorinae]